MSFFPLEKPQEKKEDEEKKETEDKDPWWKPKDTEENLSRGTVYKLLSIVLASPGGNRVLYPLQFIQVM